MVTTVASSWITARPTKDGKRYRVLYRLGGRESSPRYAGSFRRREDALARRRWIDGELAAMRVPDLRLLVEPVPARTLREAAEAWRTSRVDASENTRLMHRSAVRAMLPLLGSRPVDSITPADVQELIGALAAKGRKRETIRKSTLALGMVLDFAGVQPNPVRDRGVKLPRGEHAEISPPSAEHVEAVVRILPSRYRLPALVLDGTGMRVGELERLTWGDVDEARGRWRVSAGASKTGRARWVKVQPELFVAISALVARDDRTPERPVFQGFGADRFRTAVTRACTAAAVPHFSPHDLRHRRISLLHLAGVPWARIGEHVGQRSLRVTADTYTHVLADEGELAYAELLRL
jgi:integrase